MDAERELFDDAEIVALWREQVAGFTPITKQDAMYHRYAKTLVALSERYLWLRDRASLSDFGTPFVAIVHGDGVNSMDGSELDAAIDAAMKGGE